MILQLTVLVGMQASASDEAKKPGHFMLCCRANGVFEVYQLPNVMLIARFDELHEGLSLIPSMDGLKAGHVSSQVCCPAAYAPLQS